MDRRADILKAELLKVGEPNIQTSAQAIYNAMDENFRVRAMELLEWMAKKNINCSILFDEPKFYCQGQYLTAEQLFNNFL